MLLWRLRLRVLAPPFPKRCTIYSGDYGSWNSLKSLFKRPWLLSNEEAKKGFTEFLQLSVFRISSCLKRSLYRHTLSYLRCRSTPYYNALAISLGYLCFISTELWVGNCILLSVNVSVFSVAELVQSSAKDCDFCNHKMWVAPPETVQLPARL